MTEQKIEARAQSEHPGHSKVRLDGLCRVVHAERGDSMVLGTMGLENVFSEGLLLNLRGLPEPLSSRNSWSDSCWITEGRGGVKRPSTETAMT